MAMHDVDKGGDRRTAPQLNQNDQLLSRLAAGTNSVNYTTADTDTTGNTGLYTANKQLVRSGDITVTADGTGGNTHTVSTFSHPLGYAPLIEAALNNATITGIGSTVNIPLPTWLGLDLSGSAIAITAYTSVMVDASNIYIYTLNLTGTVLTYTVTYYLYRQRVVNS